MKSVITLCGSTRFPTAFALARMHLGLLDHVVLDCAMMGHTDEPQGAKFMCSDGDESDQRKRDLDRLHFRKIDMSGEIFVINVGGYIGDSTRREIHYAINTGKDVRYMFPDAAPVDLIEEKERWDAANCAHERR